MTGSVSGLRVSCSFGPAPSQNSLEPIGSAHGAIAARCDRVHPLRRGPEQQERSGASSVTVSVRLRTAKEHSRSALTTIQQPGEVKRRIWTRLASIKRTASHEGWTSCLTAAADDERTSPHCLVHSVCCHYSLHLRCIFNAKRTTHLLADLSAIRRCPLLHLGRHAEADSGLKSFCVEQLGWYAVRSCESFEWTSKPRRTEQVQLPLEQLSLPRTAASDQ